MSFKKILSMTLIFFIIFSLNVFSADLKQLEEQVVNKVENITKDDVEIREGGRTVSASKIEDIVNSRLKNEENNYWCPSLESFFDSYTFILNESEKYNDTFTLLLKKNFSVKNYSFKINVVEKQWSGEKPKIIIKNEKYFVPKFLEEEYFVINNYLEIVMPKVLEDNDSYIVYELIPIINNVSYNDKKLKIVIINKNAFYKMYNDNVPKSFRVKKAYRHGRELDSIRGLKDNIIGYDNGSEWVKNNDSFYKDILDLFLENSNVKAARHETKIVKEIKMKDFYDNESEKYDYKKNNNSADDILKQLAEQIVNRKENNNESKVRIKYVVALKKFNISSEVLENKVLKILEENNVSEKAIFNVKKNVDNKTLISLSNFEEKKLFGFIKLKAERKINIVCDEKECESNVELKAPFWVKWFFKDDNKKTDGKGRTGRNPQTGKEIKIPTNLS